MNSHCSPVLGIGHPVDPRQHNADWLSVRCCSAPARAAMLGRIPLRASLAAEFIGEYGS
jgi:hypothetical protein